MTPAAFKAWRESMKLTQKDLSRITGKKIGTIAALENGRRPVPQIAVGFLDLLSKQKNPKAYRPPE